MSFIIDSAGNLKHVWELSLDIIVKNDVKITAKQHDNNSRYLLVTLTADGEPVEIPSDFTPYLRGISADGRGTIAIGTIKDGKAYIEITDLALYTAGRMKVDVAVEANGEIVLSTMPFIIEVIESPYEGEGIEPPPDIYGQILAAYAQLTRDVADIKTDIEPLKKYVTPEMFGATGDGATDDTIPLQAALNSGMPVVGVGNYKITSTVFINNEYKANANSNIKLDFDGEFGVVIGGSETAYDNTQYNFDVDITVDCNNRAFSTACVALNAIKRSNIKLRGFNCAGTFYKDVYGNNGSNYENYVDINAIGTEEVGSICALLQSTDNNYNQIISRDFETCILFNTNSTQNINCVHAWLSSSKLWENSKLFAVIDADETYDDPNNIIVPRLKYNFIYQDTMRYGFYVNKIEVFGGFWFSAVNSGIVPLAIREQFPVISFYGSSVDSPSFIRTDFHEFFSNRFTTNDARCVLLNGEVNPHRTGYMYSDANDVPMGNVSVSLKPHADNAPVDIDSEILIIQNTSLRYVTQIAVIPSNIMYIRKKGTWDSSWGGWSEIGKPSTTASKLTSTHQIGSANNCVKWSNIVEFTLVLTIDTAARNTEIALLPEGYRPRNNHQITCFGLNENQYLEVLTDGRIMLQGAAISASTVLRIHSMFIGS